jgi:hypothetical protein
MVRLNMYLELYHQSITSNPFAIIWFWLCNCSHILWQYWWGIWEAPTEYYNNGLSFKDYTRRTIKKMEHWQWYSKKLYKLQHNMGSELQLIQWCWACQWIIWTCTVQGLMAFGIVTHCFQRWSWSWEMHVPMSILREKILEQFWFHLDTKPASPWLNLPMTLVYPKS